MRKYIVILHLLLCQVALSQNIVFNQEHSRLRLPNDIIDSICFKQDSTDINMSSIDGIIINGIPYDIGMSSHWKGKNIVWFGTSIPAGSDPALGQEGIGITYPEIAGSYIGAKTYNEAVGSSRASVYPFNGETWEHCGRAMGNTIVEKLQLINSVYIIDDDNQTVTLGANSYNITGLPYATAPTYAQAVSLRKGILKNSFQVKLVSKYLDETGDYLRGILNSQEVANLITYSGNIYDLLYDNEMAFKLQPDLFVIDHGTNDFSVNMASVDVSTRDITTFFGAINTYIDLINFYAPRTQIAIVTDYGTSRYNSSAVIDAQKKIAQYWQIPLLNTCDVCPFNGVKVTVQGYWDGANQSGDWHDTGFTFVDNGDNTWTSNNGIFLYKHANATASYLISTYNIRTLNGVQVYDIPQKTMYFKDGLHPHTDKSGTALKKYARLLAQMILQITY